MAGKVEARKAKLEIDLLDAAELQIETGGLSSLKARGLAAEVGCSVGAIYNVFADLNALAMGVNARTFRRLGIAVSSAVTEAGRVNPQTRLIVMATGYLHFAQSNTMLWRALFDLEMPADGPVPKWYLAELGAVFALIEEPLHDIFPDMPTSERDLMVRALFSSVHGIVLLGLERRISAVPFKQIETMLAQVLGQVGKNI